MFDWLSRNRLKQNSLPKINLPSTLVYDVKKYGRSINIDQKEIEIIATKYKIKLEEAINKLEQDLNDLGNLFRERIPLIIQAEEIAIEVGNYLRDTHSGLAYESGPKKDKEKFLSNHKKNEQTYNILKKRIMELGSDMLEINNGFSILSKKLLEQTPNSKIGLFLKEESDNLKNYLSKDPLKGYVV